MTVFYLPDLGEGLPDAEIHEWHIKVGDVVKMDAPMVAMETAKAVVDIPVPFNGKVVKLYGHPGDIIKTGAALIDIESDNKDTASTDKATVVGNLQTSDTIVEELATGIQPSSNGTATAQGIKATPSIRALAKKMQVDLAHCIGTGPAGQITVTDLENATKITTPASPLTKPTEDYEPLRGVRRAMAMAMSKSHQTVVPVTLVDDADIHAWPEKTDVSLRLIRAIMAACQREPRLNAWLDETHLALRQHPHINLGIAMDASEGLFVPVLKNVAQCSAIDLRKKIDEFKVRVKNRSIPPEDLSGATFILSNVGVFAGRYASPLIIPPMVAILAVGRISEAVVAEQGKPAIHKLLPLSLTVDHRAITGGEAARFLSALIRDLQTS
ncbi:branched-chain alpha-keto acid dehydrogenase subunit E2 [Candidatus Rickettsiella viridis]|uniref:Dihydrolipoamide acetyltransferase component of pyruvate dehydrogenase complex n=1 Tax=Candidatus Rickettsiella viridis TaxID=676208 RepID=A0A2Z5UUL6_9COXI|nr:dihydrolipoamide acetyltransferase family protein [Candidatus Rickettsiella viridis]BBB14643.1 branched-chain alpha-keto acid dehydrogenase subunit E2 [Candidatus Rickettsiella viridis]